ncbi:hypothetical protein BBOU_0969 [Bifidobacterium boum]|uniref:Uncharacterized protein n=1 Tax=Bifidobacterium boum TaxID=78343 RepID=A0A086ZLM1_9BIFI|nr:hypothetical protein BBOU_0969 [Bifidobacterium boum]
MRFVDHCRLPPSHLGWQLSLRTREIRHQSVSCGKHTEGAMGTCEIQRGEDWRNPAVSRAASCFPASGCSAPLHTCGEQTCHAQSAGSCIDHNPARPHAPACATSQDPRSRVSQCSHNHPFNSPHDRIRTTNPATVRTNPHTEMPLHPQTAKSSRATSHCVSESSHTGVFHSLPTAITARNPLLCELMFARRLPVRHADATKCG